MSLVAGGDTLNIANGIREFAVAAANRIAVSDDRGARLTFSALNERSARLGNALMAKGLARGDRVVVLLRNRHEYAETWAGLGKVGMPAVPIHPLTSPAEARYLLEHSEARGLILQTDLAHIVSDALGNLELPVILELDGTAVASSYEDALENASPTDSNLAIPEVEPCAVIYTGGTTGRPKGVLTSHRARSLAAYCGSLEWGWGRGRVNAVVVPMSNGGGFTFGYGALQSGGHLHIISRFEPEELLLAIEQQRVASVFLVPTQVQMIRDLGEDRLRKFDTSSLEVITLNAAPIPQELKEWLIAALPHVGIHELYGSTEGGIVTNLRPPDQLRKTNCVGPPWFMTRVKLLDDQGSEAAVGEVGELFSRSPFLFNGYLNDPEQTAAALTEDGFFSAGDLAIRDEENYVYIVGRKKDMIISGGMNVYPREVEEVLLQHPDVADAAVLGLPDEKWGERVTAVVIPVPGAAPDLVTLVDFCRPGLAGYKLPRELVLRSEFPRNPMGKVLKRELREELVRKRAKGEEAPADT